MNIHRFDCNDCPNYDLQKKCCHQSVLPIPSLSMAKAVEVAAKHHFDKTLFNRKRFVLPSYIKDNVK